MRGICREARASDTQKYCMAAGDCVVSRRLLWCPRRSLRACQDCCVARAQAGVLLCRLKFALPGWAEAESRRGAWEQKSAQRAAQARAFSGEGHSEEWGFFFSGSSHH